MKNLNHKYKSILWILFGIGLAINILGNVLDASNYVYKDRVMQFMQYIWLAFLVFWIIYIHKGWRLIGKKYGWVIGLLGIFQIGQFISMIWTYYKLNKAGKWDDASVKSDGLRQNDQLLISVLCIIFAILFAIQVFIGLKVLTSVSQVIKLTGATRAQAVFVLFPLFTAKKIAIGTLCLFELIIVYRVFKKISMFKKSTLNALFYSFAILSIILPFWLFAIFMATLMVTE